MDWSLIAALLAFPLVVVALLVLGRRLKVIDMRHAARSLQD